MYFAEAVLSLRAERPDVTLEGAVPYQGQEKRWSKALQEKYHRLAVACDTLTILKPTYTSGCMMERNRYMVDRSSLLIAVFDGRPGGTRNTFEYAKAVGLTIIQLPTSFLPTDLKG